MLAARYLKDRFKLLNIRNKLVECYNFLLTSPKEFLDKEHRDISFYNERQNILVLVKFLSTILVIQSSMSSDWYISIEEVKAVFNL